MRMQNVENEKRWFEHCSWRPGPVFFILHSHSNFLNFHRQKRRTTTLPRQIFSHFFRIAAAILLLLACRREPPAAPPPAAPPPRPVVTNTAPVPKPLEASLPKAPESPPIDRDLPAIAGAKTLKILF